MSERCEAQELDTPLLALKLAEATWEEMWVPSRNRVWLLADGQQGNRNLRPMNARNWTRPTRLENRLFPELPDKSSVDS